ncbi:MAG: hypothetical protein AB8B50_14345 [Pirellulaceae bacterium]
MTKSQLALSAFEVQDQSSKCRTTARWAPLVQLAEAARVNGESRFCLPVALLLVLLASRSVQAQPDDMDSVVLSKFEGSEMSFEGSATPLKFELFDVRTDRVERGLRYSAKMAGNLVFEDEGQKEDWIDPTSSLQFGAGEQVAVTSDPDLDAEIAASRGQLAPMWADVRKMQEARRNRPSVVSSFELILMEGEALLLEASIREREMERDLRSVVVAPADAEIAEGTRQSVSISSRDEVLFRYYPLSHFRFQVRLPISSWGPDWPLELEINDEPAQIIKVHSVDLDETNEQWILGIECKPSKSLTSMNERFNYRLTSNPKRPPKLGENLNWHPPSCAIVGRRRTFSLTAPKISGLLSFSRPEVSWVESGERVGQVTMEGMRDLVAKLNDYRMRAKKIIEEIESGLLPDKLIAENNPRLLRLKQYFAKTGAMIERASAMNVDAKASGLLVGTLDYQGPLTAGSKRISARIKSPFVEVPNVLIPKRVDVQDDDIVRIELPSGGHRWAKVFRVTEETTGSIQDLQTVQRVSVLIYSPDFLIGEEPQKRTRDPLNSTVESGMPVYVVLAKYGSEQDRDRIQTQLQAEFQRLTQTLDSASSQARYPILFRFRSSSLSPLEKMAYMQQASFSSNSSGKFQDRDGKHTSYTSLLTQAIIRESNPEARWIAFRRLTEQKFAAAYDPFVEIAIQGNSDVACASLFHLYEQRRAFELLTVWHALHSGEKRQESLNAEAESGPNQPRDQLCYQLLRGMLDYNNSRSDALTLFVKRSRGEPGFREQILEFFATIICTEGVNAPASIRILRGKDSSGQLFFSENELETIIATSTGSHHALIAAVYQRELARRRLLGITQNSRYGYAASFIENGFLYLRDLERIDALARSRENYFHDQQFLHSSPNWVKLFPLDPRVIGEYRAQADLLDAVNKDLIKPETSFGLNVQCTNFRHLTKRERARWIGRLGAKGDFVALVLLLRDPFVSQNSAGDILDWLLLTQSARLELARFYSICQDRAILDLIDARRFDIELLTDIDAAIRDQERMSLRDSRESALTRLSPANIHIYQSTLTRLAARDATSSERMNYLVAWFGLLPSAFELSAAADESHSFTWASEFEIDRAIEHVRQRRALQHAVSREREKRAENSRVEIQPDAAEETALRRTLEQVEAGIPVVSAPFDVLQTALASRAFQSETRLALEDTQRMALLRDMEFSTGFRERLESSDVVGYVARIVFAPFWLLIFVPLAWVVRGLLLLLPHRVAPRGDFRGAFNNNLLPRDLRRAERLVKNVDGPFRRDLAGWLEFLKSETLNLERLVAVQERLKRMMNSKELVYRVTNPEEITNNPDEVTTTNNRDSLHPERVLKLAPVLTLLSLLCRLTAERIVETAKTRSEAKEELYFQMEWFAQRSRYFSGYRYTLNPLANHQIAETYSWHHIPIFDLRELSMAAWFVAAPLNLLIGLTNMSGQLCLSLPVRMLYLFAPISILGARVFRSSLKRLVLLPGNRLEESLYSDPDSILRRTRLRLRTGWAGQTAALVDQPGGRLLFNVRRIATRLLPFVVLGVVVCGGLPLVYNMLSPNASTNWNTRSPGIYVALAAVFVLTLTMVLHWLPLLSGWLPFQHVSNHIKLRRLRRQARRELLPSDHDRLLHTPEANSELEVAAEFGAASQLRRLNLEYALKSLRLEQESDEPLLDAVVLMVENPNLLQRYRRLANSLVNKRTAVLAFVTSESMDGGGARLSTLKTIKETYPQLRQRHPFLPPKLEESRLYFMPLGDDCDPFAALPFDVSLPTSRAEARVPLTPFVMALANVQAFMRSSFADRQGDSSERFVGCITASPQRLYVGPHNVDQGGRFRGGITLVGAFESIESAVRQGSLVLMGKKAFIRTSIDHLKRIISKDAEFSRWLDPDNMTKRQLSVGQVVIERFRTQERNARHIDMCVRYIEEIQEIRNSLLNLGKQSTYDVTDEVFLNDATIHYMRHLIVPWFIAFQGGSLESYRSAVLTDDLAVRDRRRMFHQRVLELIEVFQAEGKTSRRRLPKVRFVSAPTARISYGKTSEDINRLHEAPQILFPKVEQSREAELRENSLQE